MLSEVDINAANSKYNIQKLSNKLSYSKVSAWDNQSKYQKKEDSNDNSKFNSNTNTHHLLLKNNKIIKTKRREFRRFSFINQKGIINSKSNENITNCTQQKKQTILPLRQFHLHNSLNKCKTIVLNTTSNTNNCTNNNNQVTSNYQDSHEIIKKIIKIQKSDFWDYVNQREIFIFRNHLKSQEIKQTDVLKMKILDNLARENQITKSPNIRQQKSMHGSRPITSASGIYSKLSVKHDKNNNSNNNKCCDLTTTEQSCIGNSNTINLKTSTRANTKRKILPIRQKFRKREQKRLKQTPTPTTTTTLNGNPILKLLYDKYDSIINKIKVK